MVLSLFAVFSFRYNQGLVDFWLNFGWIFFYSVYSVYLIYRIIMLSIFFHLAILMWRWLDKPLWASSLHKSILLMKVTSSDSELVSLLLYYMFVLNWLE